MKNVNLNSINLNQLYKYNHKELVSLAQKLKYQNNKVIDRLYYKYSGQLKELDIGYIRERITQNTSDDKLITHIQDAYSNLTVGGGGKLSAKELKNIDTFNKSIVDLSSDKYELLYKYFLENRTDEQIKDIKFIIGSDVAYNENMFKGSRIERTNKIMKFLENNNLLEMAESILL